MAEKIEYYYQIITDNKLNSTDLNAIGLLVDKILPKGSKYEVVYRGSTSK